MSSRTVTARETRSPSTSPSKTSALVATSVAVSKARISIAPNRDKSTPFSAVLEVYLDACRRQDAGAGFGPLDEHDRVVEVRLQVAPLRRGHTAEAEQVEMRHVDAPSIAMADREGEAPDRALNPERA